MDIRVITAAQVRDLLPMGACIDLMRDAMIALSEDRAKVPLRSVMALPGGRGLFGIMPGVLDDPACFGIKLLSLFPGNVAHGLSSHLGLVLLFEAGHGLPTALIDAAELTAVRTAAASASATRVLARKDAGDLAILGAGEQARSHLEAMSLIRRLRRVRLWARRPEAARRFAEEQGARLALTIEVAASVAEAVAGADLICTLTGAKDPILFGDQVSPGAHLNIVGSSQPGAAEIDTALLLRGRLFADARQSILKEGGEYRRAVEAGALGPDHILGEIGEVASGRRIGRQAASDITLYKSLGVAAQDLAAAHYILQRARAEGVGQVITL